MNFEQLTDGIGTSSLKGFAYTAYMAEMRNWANRKTLPDKRFPDRAELSTRIRSIEKEVIAKFVELVEVADDEKDFRKNGLKYTDLIDNISKAMRAKKSLFDHLDSTAAGKGIGDQIVARIPMFLQAPWINMMVYQTKDDRIVQEHTKVVERQIFDAIRVQRQSTPKDFLADSLFSNLSFEDSKVDGTPSYHDDVREKANEIIMRELGKVIEAELLKRDKMLGGTVLEQMVRDGVKAHLEDYARRSGYEPRLLEALQRKK